MPSKMTKGACVGANSAYFRVQKNWPREILSAKPQTMDCDMSRGSIAKIECGVRNIFAHELYFFKTALGCAYEELPDPPTETKTENRR